MLEGAGDVVGRLAGLDAALDAGAHPFLAEDADQRPAGGLQISSQTESQSDNMLLTPALSCHKDKVHGTKRGISLPFAGVNNIC